MSLLLVFLGSRFDIGDHLQVWRWSRKADLLACFYDCLLAFPSGELTTIDLSDTKARWELPADHGSQVHFIPFQEWGWSLWADREGVRQKPSHQRWRGRCPSLSCPSMPRGRAFAQTEPSAVRMEHGLDGSGGKPGNGLNGSESKSV
jgi:hypothetical protein